MDIQGKWTGTIIYGKEYREYKGKELYFDLEIIQDTEKITGTSIDIGGVGMSPDSAKIIGTFVGTKINFIKQYSSYHYLDKGKTKVDKSKNGSEIKYSGNYDEHKQLFQGNWILKGRVKLFGFIPIKYSNTGMWSMKRK